MRRIHDALSYLGYGHRRSRRLDGEQLRSVPGWLDKTAKPSGSNCWYPTPMLSTLPGRSESMARFPFPWDLLLGVIRDLPAGRRSMLVDCAYLVSRLEPAPVIEGADLVPASGPLVIAANHYQRPGLWIGWAGAVVTLAVAGR